MKTNPIVRFSAALLLAALYLSCASQAAPPSYSESSVTLDEAISGAASYLIGQIPEGAVIAIVDFASDTQNLSDYVFEEFWSRFEESGKLVMVDRRNLERIRTEMNYQMSLEVDEDLARSIGHQYGPQFIIYGHLVHIGNEYRMVIYATDVEKASSSQRTAIIRPDTRLSSLLNATLDERIGQAVAAMARPVEGPLTIAVSRISFAGTTSVSSLSAYLKDGIISGALKQQNKFRVASDSESAEFAVASRGLTVEKPVANSPIQAIVLGSFTPVDDDAEVSLRLVSTAQNNTVIAAAKFVIPAAELSRRRLTLLPEKDNAAITRAEFDAKQKAIDPYAGKNNAFAFTVTPDHLDGVYYDGEYMSMRIYAERNCYFRIVHVDVNGTAQVIYPAVGRDNNFIRSGETRSIPDNTLYRMGSPFGEEYILVAAYDRPFKVEAGSGAQLSEAVITRGLTVETGGIQSSPAATAKFSYTILPKR
jgi:hypothetical protein